jgi:hypothetical protein
MLASQMAEKARVMLASQIAEREKERMTGMETQTVDDKEAFVEEGRRREGDGTEGESGAERAKVSEAEQVSGGMYAVVATREEDGVKFVQFSSCITYGKKHRLTCHLCGNIRKIGVLCSNCPMTYCSTCVQRMIEENSASAFERGCPRCKEICCCGPNLSLDCGRKNHCRQKCLRVRNGPKKYHRVLSAWQESSLPVLREDMMGGIEIENPPRPYSIPSIKPKCQKHGHESPGIESEAERDGGRSKRARGAEA